MPLLVLLVIVDVALMVVRIGATALMMAGLSRDVAEFQAVSCFFGDLLTAYGHEGSIVSAIES